MDPGVAMQVADRAAAEVPDPVAVVPTEVAEIEAAADAAAPVVAEIADPCRSTS